MTDNRGDPMSDPDHDVPFEPRSHEQIAADRELAACIARLHDDGARHDLDDVAAEFGVDLGETR